MKYFVDIEADFGQFPFRDSALCDDRAFWELSPEEQDWVSRIPDIAVARKALKAIAKANNERLKEEAREAAAIKAAEQRARRAAKKAGARNWRGLLDAVLNPSELFQLEQFCEQQGWTVQVQGSKFNNEELCWEFRCIGLGIELTTDSEKVKALVEQASKENFSLLLQLMDHNGSSLTSGYRFRSLMHIQRTLAGFQWLQSEADVLEGAVSSKVARTLMRIPKDLRWSALKSEKPGKLELNWAEVRRATKCPATRFQNMPVQEQWKKLFGFSLPRDMRTSRKIDVFERARGLRLPSLVGLKLSVVRTICKEVGLVLEAATFEGDGAACSDMLAVLKLASLFKDAAAVKRFVLASGHPWSLKGVHDSGQFELSKSSSNFTPEKWAPLCLKHPKATTFSGSFGALEAKGILPTSLAQLRLEVRALAYPDATPQWAALREACLHANVSGSQYRSYEEFWSQNPQKSAEFLPLARVNGTEVGLDAGWAFYKLDVNDYRGPMLGVLTGCCQHLNGAGSAVARHGVRSPYSGFYVVTHGKKVVLQSWAWRTVNGDLVMDSVESLERDPTCLQGAFALFKAGVQHIKNSAFGVERVFVGSTNSGVTESCLNFLLGDFSHQAEYTSAPADDCDYFDGRNHFLVAGVSPKKSSRKRGAGLPAVEGYVSRKAKVSKDLTAELPFILRNPYPDWQQEPAFARWRYENREDYRFTERYLD